MRTFVKEISQPRVKAYNPEHSFVVSGVGRRRLRGYISQVPGVSFTRKGDAFLFRGVEFSFDDGGDMGGDGLWIITKDGLLHPDEIGVIREAVQRALTAQGPSVVREVGVWLALVGSFLICVVICGAMLQALTSLPFWASTAIAFPTGTGLFYLAFKWAE